jgi:hypothetical protein
MDTVASSEPDIKVTPLDRNSRNRPTASSMSICSPEIKSKLREEASSPAPPFRTDPLGLHDLFEGAERDGPRTEHHAFFMQ